MCVAAAPLLQERLLLSERCKHDRLARSGRGTCVASAPPPLISAYRLITTAFPDVVATTALPTVGRGHAHRRLFRTEHKVAVHRHIGADVSPGLAIAEAEVGALQRAVDIECRLS